MKNFLISTLLLTIFLTACVPQGSPTVPTPLPTLAVVQKPTYTVQLGEVIKELELRGRVTAVRQEGLFFGTNGVVDEVLVSPGDMVKAGQVLAQLTERVAQEVAVADARLDLIKAQKTLDALFDEADLHSAEALVAMLEAQTKLEAAKNERANLEKPRASAVTIDEAETHFALMEQNLTEARKLWQKVNDRPVTDPDRSLALQNLSNAQRARDSALINLNWYLGHSTEEQITSADAKLALADAKFQEALSKYERIKDGPDPYDVDLAEASLARAKLNLDKAQAAVDGLTIIAPYDGQVLSLDISPGAQVTAFKPVISFVDPEGLEITILPTSAELAELSVGQHVQIRFPNRPGQELAGVVRSLPQSSGASLEQERDQGARVSMEGGGAALSLGEVAMVLIQVERRENVLWVSPAALRIFQGRDFVIVQDDEIQRRVDIRLGLRTKDRVEVLDGLAAGQVVLGP